MALNGDDLHQSRFGVSYKLNLEFFEVTYGMKSVFEVFKSYGKEGHIKVFFFNNRFEFCKSNMVFKEYKSITLKKKLNSTFLKRLFKKAL